MTTMVPIPCDLVSSILCRLPSKSLVRFKVVSKSWGYLIDDPYLSQSHLKQSTDFSLIALHDYSDSYESYNVKIYSADMDSLQNWAAEVFPLQEYRGDITSLASCNGLVCLTYANVDVALWNITTKEYHVIRNPPELRQKVHHEYSFVFGYDSINDDYKVVRLECTQEGLDCVLHKTKVYSLRRDAWYETGAYRPSKPQLFHFMSSCEVRTSRYRMPVYIADALHCVADRVDKKPKYFILAFDLVSEDFREMPLPDSVCPLGNITLAILEGCLSVVTNENTDVWVMKDYMVKESWTKLFSVSFSIPPEMRSNWLLGSPASARNRVLFKGYDNFYWYDPKNGEAEIIENRCLGHPRAAAICAGSLVSLRAYRGTRHGPAPSNWKKHVEGLK